MIRECSGQSRRWAAGTAARKSPGVVSMRRRPVRLWAKGRRKPAARAIEERDAVKYMLLLYGPDLPEAGTDEARRLFGD